MNEVGKREKKVLAKSKKYLYNIICPKLLLLFKMFLFPILQTMNACYNRCLWLAVGLRWVSNRLHMEVINEKFETFTFQPRMLCFTNELIKIKDFVIERIFYCNFLIYTLFAFIQTNTFWHLRGLLNNTVSTTYQLTFFANIILSYIWQQLIIHDW